MGRGWRRGECEQLMAFLGLFHSRINPLTHKMDVWLWPQLFGSLMCQEGNWEARTKTQAGLHLASRGTEGALGRGPVLQLHIKDKTRPEGHAQSPEVWGHQSIRQEGAMGTQPDTEATTDIPTYPDPGVHT